MLTRARGLMQLVVASTGFYFLQVLRAAVAACFNTYAWTMLVLRLGISGCDLCCACEAAAAAAAATWQVCTPPPSRVFSPAKSSGRVCGGFGGHRYLSQK